MIIGTQTAIFNKKGDLLIAKRSEFKKLAPGKWNLIGGKVEKEESIEEGAKREIEEETRIKIEKLYYQGKKIVSWGGDPFECHTFIAFSDKIPILNPEHSEYKYISEPEEIIGYSKEEINKLFQEKENI